MRTRQAEVWLRQHNRAEQRLTHRVGTFFKRQADRIAAIVSEYRQPGPSLAPSIFKPADERQRFWKAIQPDLLRLCLIGAEGDERSKAWDNARWQKRRQDVPGYLDIPAQVVARIRQHLDELAQQDYWQDIQETTLANLTDILENGLREGQTTWEISKIIRGTLGDGDEAKTRAKLIARTETTASLNSGHDAQIQALAADGVRVSKVWLAILDGDVRPEHRDANEQTVPAGANFSVGGFDVPYPGWFGLPAAQRVNCRCTIVSDF